MKHYLTAIDAVIRGTWTVVAARLDEDEQGPFTVIEVTVSESGEPLFEDDAVVGWHISETDLHAIAREYARFGRMLPRTACEPVLAEVVTLPVRDVTEVAA